MINAIIEDYYECLKLIAMKEPERDFDIETAKVFRSIIKMMESKDYTNPYSNDSVEIEIANFVDRTVYPSDRQIQSFQQPRYIDAFLLAGQTRVINNILPGYERDCIAQLNCDLKDLLLEEDINILSLLAHRSVVQCLYYCYWTLYKDNFTQAIENNELRTLVMNIYNELAKIDKQKTSMQSYGYLYLIARIISIVTSNEK